ncbi:GGDEF domain-containing protein [Acinetobacter sp. ANC 4470]|uniref:GGDEF domain-containing protein n=1 Tax=Acinetobacter sp. ANC 4470 TaxID=1977881 RepID=UPI000A334ACD|nr:GGDEF domain-containing protein [Acinetobacter sp. ANC 4470]OTG64969.1 GGDEF domain-containing protein [Acinetobacter sp. ANC 4470]
MGSLFLICHFFFKAPHYLLWLGMGYIVPAFALAAQCLMSNQQMTMSSPILGIMYLFGAWASAYAMALRKNAQAHSKLAWVLIVIITALLGYYAFVDEQLWIRMLILNLGVAIVQSLVLISMFAHFKQNDWLNKIVDLSYLFIAFYTFVRSLIIFLFLKNIEVSMLSTSVWWLMMLAASILLSMWFAIVLLGTMVRDIISKLNEERSRDSLTYLLNRRGFYDFAKVNLAQLPVKKYFLLMCDIDHFKKINDSYGHLVGDQILQQVGVIISQNVRENDLAGRFGGEEFIILLQVEQVSSAYEIAERIRVAIETELFSEKKISITASFGLTHVENKNLTNTIDIADKLLYDAKRAGRNCVVLNMYETEKYG